MLFLYIRKAVGWMNKGVEHQSAFPIADKHQFFPGADDQERDPAGRRQNHQCKQNSKMIVNEVFALMLKRGSIGGPVIALSLIHIYLTAAHNKGASDTDFH